MRNGIPGIVIAVLAICSPIGVAWADGQRCLNDIERNVTLDHPKVLSMTAEQFEARLAEHEQVVVFDVREKAEFDTSRLPGAIRVEPHLSAAAFMKLHGGAVAGKTVLLYCSVGVRSSKLAERIDGAVRAAGARGAYNLRGGVFSWHNTGRKLENVTGGTDLVHGYNRPWSRYIDFDNLTRLAK